MENSNKLNQSLIDVFLDTQNYYNENEVLKQNVRELRHNTKLIDEGENPSIRYVGNHLAKVQLSNKRTFQAAMDLHRDYPAAKIAVLNFASAVRPGGGVKKGSKAQEEGLCRCSTLFASIDRKWLWEQYYNVNRAAKNVLHTDACIYSPDVMICKSDDDEMRRLSEDEFCKVDVISCAAPNLRRVPGNSHNPEGGDPVVLSFREQYKLHVKRARHIMQIAASEEVDILILGAFGCGAFYNDNRAVAEAYKQVTEEYKQCFDIIEFAIPGRPTEGSNNRVFGDTLKPLMEGTSLIPKNQHAGEEDESYYEEDVYDFYDEVPDFVRSLIADAKSTFKTVEKMLYSAPAFINALEGILPIEEYHAVLSREQRNLIKKGALKLMTKKDGKLLATLIDTDTKKIFKTVPLEKVNLSPDLNQAMISYTTQMQLAQIAEKIQYIETAIETVRKGMEYDRLATAYSCQQKLLQAMALKNIDHKASALMRLVADAEDSRNLLMLSQNANIEAIKQEPEDFFKKVFNGSSPDKIALQMNEIRESLNAVNMVSLVEALAYHELGEDDAAVTSLEYYANYIEHTYLESEGLVDRLDLLDQNPANYWTNAVPEIKAKIDQLPFIADRVLLEEGE